MDRYEKSAEFLMKRGDEILAERKRRKAMILRSFAIGVGAAAVLGVGLTTYALRPPKKPTPSQSAMIVETENKLAETTVAQTSSSTTVSKTTATKQVTTAVSTTATTSSARQNVTTVPTTSRASRTSATAARTTEAAVNTTAVVQTSLPTVTSLAPTSKDIEERIANIVMRMPEMITVVQALPAVNENGEHIPTFSMLVDEHTYFMILKYDNGELDYSFDINNDGIVDVCDVLEYKLCCYCKQFYVRWNEYPRDFDELFPDKDIFQRASAFYSNLYLYNGEYYLTDYMIYHKTDIPDAETIEEIAREYAGDRPIPDDVYKNVSKDMSSIKQSFDANYERNYIALNRKENEYPEFQLVMYKKLDSGEVFPDADRDGSIGYMDTYYILKYYAEKATGFSRGVFSDSDIEWIEGHCDIDTDGRVDAKEAAWLMNYLFYYKKYDYVTHIEMEYRASQEPEIPVVTIKPST